MEFKKDNSSISHGYQIKNNALIFGSNGYLGSFLNNESIHIIKRTERVTTAIYLVTECLPESEPLREKIRTCALDLISVSHELMRDTGVSKFSFEGDFVLSLIELRSLVSLGMSVSLVSSMNGTLLISEISALIQDIETEKISRLGEFGGTRPHLRHKEVLITKEMFDVPVVEMMEKRSSALTENSMTFNTQSTQKSNVLYKGHQVSVSPSKGHVVQKVTNDRPITQQKEVAFEATNSKSDIAIRLGRRNTILKLIKDKREVTIREVSIVVPDVSEKTIQRELLNLVSEGVLKKTGEKRWSKYSLNS